MQRKPLTSRPLDLIYLIFFLIHIPIMFLIDLYPLYPTSIPAKFPFLTTLRTFYKNTYRDRFFTGPAPAWFTAYTWMELLIHVPVSLYAVKSLLGRREDPILPLVLLALSVQIAITTGTCVAEVSSWEGYSGAEVRALMGLYVPYLIFAVFMGLDMFARARRTLLAAGDALSRKKSL